MISEAIYPRTQSDLVRAIQRMQINRISIVEPYDRTRDADVAAALREAERGTGDVTVIVLRSR